ncbi:MAG: hypothetical protein B7Z26_00085 [Asticcacaulis sp. 32-58-5]|nr:MAG: hypothetical protein B7Z26_00085 [Asticcacaulis sp. 32-58-5]
MNSTWCRFKKGPSFYLPGAFPLQMHQMTAPNARGGQLTAFKAFLCDSFYGVAFIGAAELSIKHQLVRDLVGSLVGASDIFRRYDIDFYRIGGLTLWQAAARQAVSVDLLSADLSGLPLNPASPPASMMGLITFIDTRYHNVHRKQVLSAIRLAKAIQLSPKFAHTIPLGLGNLLTLLFDTLEDHQLHEEEELFPAMVNSPQHTLTFPVYRAVLEHDEISDQLDTLSRLTGGYAIPETAHRCVRLLYALCSSLDGDLRLHMHLENNLLFPHFIGEGALAS